MALLHPHLIRDPVDLPCLAAVFRERLLEVGRLGRGRRPDVADENHAPLQFFVNRLHRAIGAPAPKEIGLAGADFKAQFREYGRKALARWTELADAGDLQALALDLMQNHYDPAYDRAAKKQPTPRLGLVELAGLTAEAQEAGADAIASIVETLPANA